MKEFSYQQKIAMMRVLLDIMNADGKIDMCELALFNKLSKDFHLESLNKNDIDNKLSLLALVDIKNFTEEQKEDFAKYMNEMIIADEDINRVC